MGVCVYLSFNQGSEWPCGIYMPEMMWWQDGGRWSFRCGLNIEKIRNFMPETYQACQKAMPNVPEEHWQRHCGVDFCGVKFVPWKKGASKVVELNVGGNVMAFLAERLPEQLDDEIKKLLHDWHVAQRQGHTRGKVANFSW